MNAYVQIFKQFYLTVVEMSLFDIGHVIDLANQTGCITILLNELETSVQWR